MHVYIKQNCNGNGIFSWCYKIQLDFNWNRLFLSFNNTFSRHRDSLADITDTSSTADANNFSAFTFGGLIRTETQKTLEDDESSFAATGGKRRRMTAESAWSSGNHSDEVGGGSSGDDHQESMGRRAAELEFVNLRLASFSRADPSLPKGTFMVLKEEVFKAECPLWKIDNQNLLQKYPPIQRPDGGGTSPIWYRNSSTVRVVN